MEAAHLFAAEIAELEDRRFLKDNFSDYFSTPQHLILRLILSLPFIYPSIPSAFSFLPSTPPPQALHSSCAPHLRSSSRPTPLAPSDATRATPSAAPLVVASRLSVCSRTASASTPSHFGGMVSSRGGRGEGRGGVSFDCRPFILMPPASPRPAHDFLILFLSQISASSCPPPLSSPQTFLAPP